MIDMNTLTRKFSAVLALSTFLFAGCGGSSSSDGGVSPPPPPPPTGGITRTGVGVAAGPITGFGSVWVNGVEYNTDTATFIRDGDDSAQEIEFKEGETVIVKGTIDDDNTNAVAESVELDELVKGPATDLVDLNTVIVMGQTVDSDAGTWVDDNCAPATWDNLTGLDTFFAVEVYGSVQDDEAIPGTRITATRIECKTAGDFVDDEFEVNGIVSGNVPGNTFMINALQVNYSATPLIQNFPNGAPEDGQPVEVKGDPATFVSSGDPDVLAASKVEFKGNRLDGNEGDHFEFEGFITDFQSATDFKVRIGNLLVEVTTDSNTDYEPAGASAMDLNDNLKVEVEGEDNGSGQKLATKIEIKSSTNIRVTGLVDTGSVGTDTFTIMDIVVNTIDGTTRFEDNSDAPTDPTVIVAGDYLEVRGQEKPSGQITAFRVERDDFDSTRTDQYELRGFVTSKTMPTTPGTGSLTILGVTVDTDGNTEYRDVDDTLMLEGDFWAAVVEGESLVDAKGDKPDPGAARMIAEELELESQ
jgi:hypothetical protein